MDADKRVDEISRLIKMLKRKTSASFDLVSNLMIKKLLGTGLLIAWQNVFISALENVDIQINEN